MSIVKKTSCSDWNVSEWCVMMKHSMCGKDSRPVRIGATRAQDDMGDLPERVERAEIPPTVILDFFGIEAINGSYVRASAAWLLNCSIAARVGEPTRMPRTPDQWEVRPLAIQALFVANLSGEVREEIDLLFKQLRLPCLEAVDWDETQVGNVRILGHLDPQLFRALECLESVGNGAVAETLWQRFPEDRIGMTAWNNRLSELYQRHMVSRTKDGKFWRYSLEFKEANYGI